MKFLLIFTLITIACINAERYVPNSHDPNSPGDCYHKELKIAVKKGETIKPTNIEQCVDFTCEDDGLIRVSICSRVDAGCKNSTYIPTDYTKEFPQCCEHYKCP